MSSATSSASAPIGDDDKWQPALFAPFGVRCDVAFFARLQHQKLHKYHLDTSNRRITATVATSNAASIDTSAPAMTPIMSLTADSFPADDADDSRESPATAAAPHESIYYGSLHNTNTISDFQSLPYAQLLHAAGQSIAASILDGSALEHPDACLNRLMLLTFADLKSYVVHYWAAVPALIDEHLSMQVNCKADDQLTTQQQRSFALAYLQFVQQHANTSFFMCRTKSTQASSFELLTLSEFASLHSPSTPDISSTLCFFDSVSHGSSFSWCLRNALTLLAHSRLAMRRVRVLCLRDVAALLRCNAERSGKTLFNHRIVDVRLAVTQPLNADVRCVGFERNQFGKLAPRTINLSLLMNDTHLAESSVQLNLQLMRWRQLPDLQLDRLSKQKCLLLGAGTLGCNVARLLMAWGVRCITFVDSGSVSYSNPVRQSLYTHADCVSQQSNQSVQGKAHTAAQALKDVYPLMHATGHRIIIGMPGHAAAGVEEDAVMRQSVQRLSELIDEHDATFLLTDSRESRWLPTLLCATMDRPCMNAALGFESFLVMRHGQPVDADDEKSNDSHSDDKQSAPIGCYFCSDVVAPANSQLSRTLDQQCTVSRPGLSYIASALLVELYVSMLHHPLGHRASSSLADEATLLGPLPHQLRGNQGGMAVRQLTGQRFKHCTACSQAIMQAYKLDGIEFVMRVLNGSANNSVLEDMSGLTKMKQETELQMKLMQATMSIETDDEAEADDDF